ncbi:MAG: hypothetical protein Q7J54_03950 [Candidatus Woesearchaeota archaeon]|nr:hypothetical protein [Candidatus Woesearchaeota archaeon]
MFGVYIINDIRRMLDLAIDDIQHEALREGVIKKLDKTTYKVDVMCAKRYLEANCPKIPKQIKGEEGINNIVGKLVSGFFEYKNHYTGAISFQKLLFAYCLIKLYERGELQNSWDKK